jgi:hypothetical protein
MFGTFNPNNQNPNDQSRYGGPGSQLANAASGPETAEITTPAQQEAAAKESAAPIELPPVTVTSEPETPVTGGQEGTDKTESAGKTEGAPAATPASVTDEEKTTTAQEEGGKSLLDYVNPVPPAEARGKGDSAFRQSVERAAREGLSATADNPKITVYDGSGGRMEGPNKDAYGQPLNRTEDVIAGKAPYITVASEKGPDGKPLLRSGTVDVYDRKTGQNYTLPFQTRDTGSAFPPGTTHAYDFAVNNRNEGRFTFTNPRTEGTIQTAGAQRPPGDIPTQAASVVTPSQIPGLENYRPGATDRYGNLVFTNQPTTEKGATTRGTLTFGDVKVPYTSGGSRKGDAPDGIFPIHVIGHGGTGEKSGLPAQYDPIARVGDRSGNMYDRSIGQNRSAIEIHAIPPGDKTTAGCIGIPGGVNGPYADLKNAIVAAQGRGEQLYLIQENRSIQIVTAPQLQAMAGGQGTATAAYEPPTSPYQAGEMRGGQGVYNAPEVTPGWPGLSGIGGAYSAQGQFPAGPEFPSPFGAGWLADRQMAGRGGEFPPGPAFPPTIEQGEPGPASPKGDVTQGPPLEDIGINDPLENAIIQSGQSIPPETWQSALDAMQPAPNWNVGEQRQGVAGNFPEGPLIQAPGPPAETLQGYPSVAVERAGQLPSAMAEPSDTFGDRFGGGLAQGAINMEQPSPDQSRGDTFGDRFGNLPPAQEQAPGPPLDLAPPSPGPGLEPGQILQSGQEGPGVQTPDTFADRFGNLPPAAEQTQPPTEPPPAAQPPTDNAPFTPPDLVAGPKPPGAAPPPSATDRDRAVQIFDKAGAAAQAKMSAADRQQSEKYAKGVTDQMKQDLMTGKLSPEEFMAKSANNVGVYFMGIKINVTPEDIKSNAADKLAGFSKDVQAGRAEFTQGKANDAATQNAFVQSVEKFNAAMGEFETKMGASASVQERAGVPLAVNEPSQGPMTVIPGIPSVPNPEAYPPGIHEMQTPQTPQTPQVPPSAIPTAPGGGAPVAGPAPPAGAGAPNNFGGVPAPFTSETASPAYGSGVSAPVPPAQVAQRYPQQVRQIAMRFRVDLATAAAILAQSLAGAPTPHAAMAQGGHARSGEPILVGERGPEVIVPNAPSTVIPGDPREFERMYGQMQNAPQFDLRAAPPGFSPQPAAWDRWLADLPESSNVVDLRTPEQKAEDNNKWRLTWDPTLTRPAPKPLKQFPPVVAPPPAQSTLPAWLQDQQSQWTKAKGGR